MAKSPLFKTYGRRQQRKAAAEFRRTEIGQAAIRVLRGITSPPRKKRTAGYRQAAKPASRGDVLGAIEKFAGDQLRAEIRRMGVGPVFSAIEKYARGGNVERQVISALIGALGPVGTMVEKIIASGVGQTGKRRAGDAMSGELQAAAELLRSFGFGVIPPLSGADEPQAVEAMIRELEKRGYEVTKRRPARQQPDLQETDEAREARPGAVDTISGKPLVTKRGKPRKVVDLPMEGRQRRVRTDDPLVTGEMIGVSSSNVHSIGYDFDAARLKVRFLAAEGGPGPLYFYQNVPPEIFQSFRTAASKGGFVWDRLRIRGTVSGHRYDYSLAGITAGYVPRKATLIGGEEWYIQRRVKAGGAWYESQRGDEMVSDAMARFRGRGGRPDRGAPDRGSPDRGRP